MSLSDMPENDPLSLQTYCRTCPTSCCTGSQFIVPEIHYAPVLAAGHSDLWHEVTLPVGKYYVNDYRRGTCAYFIPGQGCGIQDVKPPTCQAYPVYATTNDDGSIQSFGRDEAGCPAAKAISKKFELAAQEYLRRQPPENPRDIAKVYRAWTYKHDRQLLASLEAVVTRAPSLAGG